MRGVGRRDLIEHPAPELAEFDTFSFKTNRGILVSGWQEARLISVAGISGDKEAEQRATSALLAVLGIVRPFSKELLSQFGASKAENALVETFIETSFKTSSGSTVRPDGLIRVSYGKQEPWVALVEVKTGKSNLDREQLESYVDVAKLNGFASVISISNEIPPTPGMHPTGLRLRANSKVSLEHISWTRVLTTAVMEKLHHGIEDPEQAWILGELIRYLEHPNSGAVGFDDMGDSWIGIRDGAREGTLSKRTEGITDVAQRWDQLLGFTSLKLGADIGRDVYEVVPRAHQSDPSLRTKAFIDSLADSGRLEGSLRIPDTIADLDIEVDLKGRQNVVSATFDAPSDKGAKGRIGWLTRQLKDAPAELVVESYTKNARSGIAAKLIDVRDDSSVLIGEDKKEPVKFRLTARSEMGLGRKAGKKPGFSKSVIDSIESFYGDVLQNLTAYQARAPKMNQRPRPAEVEAEPLPTVELIEAEVPKEAISQALQRWTVDW